MYTTLFYKNRTYPKRVKLFSTLKLIFSQGMVVAKSGNYLLNRDDKIKNCLSLLLDLSNPSPAIGWANQERLSLAERGPADLIMALALIHHLVISYNLNFGMTAEYLQRLGRNLIIEFVPKEDSQVQKLLRNRKDIFTDYNQSVFEKEFSKKFKILSCRRIKDSLRSVYLMRASV